MAKMFYSLQEAAEKLGVSEDQIVEMADEGKIQQFRDRDKLMFKRDQIDALADQQPTGLTGLAEMADTAGDEDFDDGPIPLADSGDTDTDVIDIAQPPSDSTDRPTSSDSSMAVSVFDADEVDLADSGAKTQISETFMDEDELALENVGSGSGLLDLTRESDDTSLGAELLDEIYPGGGESSDLKMEAGPSASGVFDGAILADEASSATGLEHLQTSAAPPVAATMPISVPTEAYDAPGSGFTGGLLIGAMAVLIIGLVVGIFAVRGVPSEMTASLAANQVLYIVVMFAGCGLLGLAGFLIGKSQKPA